MHGNHRILCVLLFSIGRNRSYLKSRPTSLSAWFILQLRPYFKDGFIHELHFYCEGTKCIERLVQTYWLIILMWNNLCWNPFYDSQTKPANLITLLNTKGHFHKTKVLEGFSAEVIRIEGEKIWLRNSCRAFYYICWWEECYLART